jgi:hypothetical protein
MPDTSDFLRAAQANVVVHSHRAMRVSVLTGVVTAAVAIMVVALNPHAWWLAAVFGASLALNAHTVTKARYVLAFADASAIRWWMRPVAYAYGVGGAGALAWALWQFALSVGAT